MNDLPSPASTEALLAHAEWVRALARTLVHDPAGADDVAQASWLVALEHPPRDTRNLRGWLARIVRNSAGQRARSEARRDRRERNSARHEALPDTAELVAQAELQREVVGHVLALDEPYRTTVLLRFFRDLDARAIAARQQVPPATVRTRLQRAMAQLRERLDRSRGGRASWCAALELLAGGREATAAWVPTSMVSGGAALMGMTWKAGAVALVAAATLWIWVRTSHDDSPTAAQASSAQGPEAVAALVAAVEGGPGEVPPDQDRASVSPPAATPDPGDPVAPEQEIRRVDGRVVDSAGRSIGGLRLVAWAEASDGGQLPERPGSHVRTTTAPDGAFVLDVPGRYVHVESEDLAWVLTCEGQPIGGKGQLRVAVRATTVAGIVVDEGGAPVADANLELVFNCSTLAEFPFLLYGVERRTWRTQSGADGRFRFEGVAPHSEVSVTHDGYEPARGAADETETRIVLRAATTPQSRALRGLVVDPLGVPIAGADVRFDRARASSDEHGRFELAITRVLDVVPLSASKAGHAAAVLERFGETLRTKPESWEGIVLRMGEAPLGISGRLLDDEGHPRPGWTIDLVDGTPLGDWPVTVEFDTATGGRGGAEPVTDAEGRFSIGGLRNRTYRVRAADSSQCLFVVSDPTAAGTAGLELVVPRDMVRPVVRGRALSERGEPIAGAIVRLQFIRQVMASGDEWIESCRETQTDAEGRFVFENLVHRHVFLTVDGPHVQASGRFEIPDSGDVELRASVFCRFRVDVRPDDPADRILVLDGDGKEMSLRPQSASATQLGQSVKRRDDGFPVCFVGEGAATLVLFRGDVELRRMPLMLHPNELRIVTP